MDVALPPHGEDHDRTDAFRGARFTRSDLAGATFRDCDLSGVRIAGSWLDGAALSGGFSRLTVNDVDVTAFVAAELDRRHPERVRVREMRTADDHRAAWELIERRWAETVARARRLPEPARHERVDGEWSITETLRHLVFATDSWAGHMILGDPAPFHPMRPGPGERHFRPSWSGESAARSMVTRCGAPPAAGRPASGCLPAGP